MAKNPHPADLANAALIAQAASFSVNLFLGRGEFDRAEAATIDEARALAARMLAAHPTCSRRPLIYAVTREGRAAVVDPGRLAAAAE
ncbi:hypothetical protein [Methylocystis echinoides]|uniref:Uncharacterized protein n=1 Tax=Methylocystis echinoides TaxID=29468 RepID=A0A9W6GWD6_9HYPH|nr:hypothetical protein [Methylocystis echinoides]GLI94316.1 hypothetical protein LMG27198_33080 [Methylocystis echinoides]